jgi:hypothetical protein
MTRYLDTRPSSSSNRAEAHYWAFDAQCVFRLFYMGLFSFFFMEVLL